MIFTALQLKGAFLIEPTVIPDDRGWFYRYYSANDFKQIGHHKPWVQLNHSYTKNKGTLRGLHFQLPPHAEIKLVKCISGGIMDVIIDLRDGSPTFLQWVALELTAENRRMLYIPEGFAHGFQALTDDCEMIYHHSASYTKDAEGGIRWNDPLIDLNWPLPPVHISDRDLHHPLLDSKFSGIKLS